MNFLEKLLILCFAVSGVAYSSQETFKSSDYRISADPGKMPKFIEVPACPKPSDFLAKSILLVPKGELQPDGTWKSGLTAYELDPSGKSVVRILSHEELMQKIQ